MPTYKSFFWVLGTTSFRTREFNRTIEEQLQLLDEFWNMPVNSEEVWNNALQIRYYDFIKEKGFLSGEANRKDKDAREKTSGLVDIGLITEDRKLSGAGTALLDICKSGVFTSDNFFQIPRDSYLYLKQLLKTSNSIDGSIVRPLIVLLRVLSEFDFISFDEFKYLLPLCINDETTTFIIQKIHDIRNNLTCIDDVIIERLMDMDNYKEALTIFLESPNVCEELICSIGMNRKSRSYDRNYFSLYQSLFNFYMCRDNSALLSVYECTSKIRIGSLWRSYLFNTSSKNDIIDKPRLCLNCTLFDNIETELEFKMAFFKVMHLLKAKSTLKDYMDLNRRYIKTTDIILFENNRIKLDIIPKHFFNSIIEDLFVSAFEKNDKLFENCLIHEIDECLVVNESMIIEGVNSELHINVSTVEAARLALEDDRYRRLQKLIDEKFTDIKLLHLLDLFEKRNDDKIKEMVTENADIPTIFEYVLGILWYIVSEKKGKILDYMKLQLDADLLPITHAIGGEADIVYEYSETEYYPKHTLLLEATLADRTNQRRMEMEPVSRHLGFHLIRSENPNTYCVFATPYLDRNVVSDFRGRKDQYFYDPQDEKRFIKGMNIIPLENSELKSIIHNHKTYSELYSIFKNAYESPIDIPNKWYLICIKKCLQE